MIRMFTVTGTAVGKQVARIAGRKGRGRHGYTPTKTAEYMARVRRAYLDAFPDAPELTGALGLTIIEYRNRPKAHYKKSMGKITTNLYDWAPYYCSTTPDLSNLTKGIEDALQSNPKKYYRGCYGNDSQIALYHDSKQVYKDRRDMEPWVEVIIFELEANNE